MKPALDFAGRPLRDTRVLPGLVALTPDGREMTCSSVTIQEFDGIEDPYYLEVICWGVEDPPYPELFPEHEEAYRNQFKEG